MKLERTKQCKTCPFKKGNDPFDIPNYDEELHEGLKSTIATDLSFGDSLKIMACHYSKIGNETPCVGWLVNQLGAGNNIGLRLKMMSCENADEIEVFGEQHEKFEDTLPKNRNK